MTIVTLFSLKVEGSTEALKVQPCLLKQSSSCWPSLITFVNH